MVRQGDDAWFNVVKWTYFALLNAEELGVTQANVDEHEEVDQSRDQARLARRRRAISARASASSNDWAAQIVKDVGNYGEIFERNVGESTPLKIARGKNALWSKGGLQYAPPIR